MAREKPRFFNLDITALLHGVSSAEVALGITEQLEKAGPPLVFLFPSTESIVAFEWLGKQGKLEIIRLDDLETKFLSDPSLAFSWHSDIETFKRSSLGMAFSLLTSEKGIPAGQLKDTFTTLKKQEEEFKQKMNFSGNNENWEEEAWETACLSSGRHVLEAFQRNHGLSVSNGGSLGSFADLQDLQAGVLWERLA